MVHRPRLIAFATLACIALSSGAAFAAKTVISAGPIPGATATKIQVGQVPLSGTVACELGVTGPAVNGWNYLLPPNDAYYSLVNPADCSGCSGAIQLTVGHMYLYFQQPTNCAIPISVGVVGTEGDVACFAPDPSQVLCGRLNYNVTVPAPGLYDIGLPLPAACCIDKPAFLEFTFNAGSSCQPLPAIVTTADCSGCQSYNIYPAGFDDLCPILGGDLVMFADAACCGTTNARASSWGNMKALYR